MSKASAEINEENLTIEAHLSNMSLCKIKFKHTGLSVAPSVQAHMFERLMKKQRDHNSRVASPALIRSQLSNRADGEKTTTSIRLQKVAEPANIYVHTSQKRESTTQDEATNDKPALPIGKLALAEMYKKGAEVKQLHHKQRKLQVVSTKISAVGSPQVGPRPTTVGHFSHMQKPSLSISPNPYSNPAMDVTRTSKFMSKRMQLQTNKPARYGYTEDRRCSMISSDLGKPLSTDTSQVNMLQDNILIRGFESKSRAVTREAGIRRPTMPATRNSMQSSIKRNRGASIDSEQGRNTKQRVTSKQM